MTDMNIWELSKRTAAERWAEQRERNRDFLAQHPDRRSLPNIMSANREERRQNGVR